MTDSQPSTRREWAELIASQFETDAIDAIEEGICRGEMLTRAQPAPTCPTCGAADTPEFCTCSDGFHAPGETYWPVQPAPVDVVELVHLLEDAVEYDTRCQEADGIRAEAIQTATERRLKARENLVSAIPVSGEVAQDSGGISGSRASTEPASRLGPSGFDPGRELPTSCYDKELRLFTLATTDLWRAIQCDEMCDLTECTFKFGGNCHCMATFLSHGMEAVAIATEARRAETPESGSVHEGAGGEAVSPNTPPRSIRVSDLTDEEVEEMRKPSA